MLAQDRVDEAAAALDEAPALVVPDERPVDRLMVDYARGDVAEAMRGQLARHADPQLDAESRFYAALHAVAIGRRLTAELSAEERTMLREIAPLVPADAWAQHLRRFLLGEETDAQVLARAWVGSEYAVAAQRCEAYYFLGMVALAAGDTATALNHFEASVRTGVVDFIEHGLSRQELRRLAPERVPVATPPERNDDTKEKPRERGPRSLEDAEPSWVVPA